MDIYWAHWIILNFDIIKYIITCHIKVPQNVNLCDRKSLKSRRFGSSIARSKCAYLGRAS